MPDQQNRATGTAKTFYANTMSWNLRHQAPSNMQTTDNNNGRERMLRVTKQVCDCASFAAWWLRLLLVPCGPCCDPCCTLCSASLYVVELVQVGSVQELHMLA
jgi:hypothetical protein